MNAHPSKKAKLIFISEESKEEIKESEGFLLNLGFGSSLEVRVEKKDIPDNAVAIVNSGIEVYMPSRDLVDIKCCD